MTISVWPSCAGKDTAENDGQTRNTRQPRPAADCQPHATRRRSRCGRFEGARSADVRDGPLIAQSLRGTPEAFVEIVRRHEVAIHGYLTRRAGLRAADDLLGEVWVRAFGARHRYDTSHEDARPWLYGIARNVLRAHWRTGQNMDLALPEEVL